jgi:hypothetical protein
VTVKLYNMHHLAFLPVSELKGCISPLPVYRRDNLLLLGRIHAIDYVLRLLGGLSIEEQRVHSKALRRPIISPLLFAS